MDLATEQFSELTRPGAFLVDVLPFLRHVPSWFPGGGYKNELKAWTMTVEEMADMPHEFVKQQMVSLTLPSFTSLYSRVFYNCSFFRKLEPTFRISHLIFWRLKN